MKNYSDTIGNRIRDLLACSAVPQCLNQLRHSAPLSKLVNLAQISSLNCSRDSLKLSCESLLYCELYGVVKMHNSWPLLQRVEGKIVLGLAH